MDEPDVSLSTTCSLGVHWVSHLPPPTPAYISAANNMDAQGVFLSTNSNMDLQGLFISTANRMDVQGVTISTARSIDVQCAVCMPVHCQYVVGRAGCTPFYAGMSDCPAYSQSGTGINKSADAENIPVPE